METESEDPTRTQLNFVGFWVRYAAFILDGFILIIPYLVLVFGFALLSGQEFDASRVKNLEFPLNLTLLLIFWGYHVFFITNSGATPGKRLFKIKVLRTDQKPN